MSVQEGFRTDGYIDVKVRRYDPEKKAYKPWKWIEKHKHNLKTNAGLTFFLKQCYGSTASGTAMANTTTGTNFMAVTTTAITPAVGDTTLSGEMTTLGFSRAQAATTVAQPTATITLTYTATGTATNVQAGALFDAASAGNMGHEFTFTATSFATNDQLQITVTVTIS